MKKILLFLLVSGMALSCSSDSADGSLAGAKDGQGGSTAIFALVGDYLYTVDHASINVFSLIDQANPVKVNEVEVGWDIETLFARDEYLYIGSREGMYIYSIANAENPQYVSNVQHMRACDPVVANATHSFVTLHSLSSCGGDLNVLQVYETTNLSAPTMIHQRNLVHPKGLGLYGSHYLFVCDDQIKVFDIANPAEPVLVKSIDKLCFDVIIRDNTLFAIGENSLTRYLIDPLDIGNIQEESEVIF